MIDGCLAEYTINDPAQVVGGRKLMTMGADQGKTGHVSVVEWTLNGPPGKDIQRGRQGKLVWFGKFGEEDWGYLDELMREWQILACVVDADPNINEARRFARRFYGFVWLTRYRSGTTARRCPLTTPMTAPDRRGRAGPIGCPAVSAVSR